MVKSLLLNNNSLQQFINKESFEPASIHDFPLAQVLNYIHDGVVVVNEKGVIVYANPSYTRILRVPVEKVIGRKMKSLEPDARILTVLETGIPILQEPVYLDHLNAEVIVDATPLYGNGKIIGGVTVFKQVGEVIGYYNALTKLTTFPN
jgi:transcriptional regulator with PAS, ATPase and Fis domain